MRLPKEWKKKETKTFTKYESQDYLIYIWKKDVYTVEAFKKGSGYKTRLFSRDFKNKRDMSKFVTGLLKQKRIMRYQTYKPLFE